MNDTKTTVEEENIATYIYYSIIGLASLICVIICTNLVGIFHALCPRPIEDEPCMNCSRAQGARWLLASSGLTFVGYWLFILIVMATFAAGGLLYTEMCRSVVYYNDPNSAKVLNVYDKLLNESLDLEIEFFMFDTYSTCAGDESLYTAFKVGCYHYITFVALCINKHTCIPQIHLIFMEALSHQSKTRN